MNLEELFVYCNHLTQDRDRWWDFVNPVMNLLVTVKYKDFFGQMKYC